jgi:hypothetical protein
LAARGGPPTVEQVRRRAGEQEMRTRALGLVGLVAMLQGCLAGSSPLPAVVEVRDAGTGVPVAHAVVRTTGGNVFIPPRDVLGPPLSPPATPAGARAETDAAGRADIVLAGNRPNELTVTASEYAPLHLTLETNSSSVRGANDWTEGRPRPFDPNTAPAATLQVRVRAAKP